MFLVDEVAPDAPEAGPLTPLEYADRPADRPVGRAGQQGRADAQRRRRLSARCSRRSMPREERRAGELHLPRRRGGPALHRGADPRPSPRRGGAGADRRHRRRLLLVGHLRAAARGRRAGRPVPAFLRAVEDAVPQPAQPSQAPGGRRPHRLHRRHQHRRTRTCWRPIRRIRCATRISGSKGRWSSSSPRPSPTTGCTRPARSCSTRRWFPELAAGRRCGRARDHVRAGRGPRADRVRDPARHLLRAPLDPRRDAVLPAARRADHGARPRRHARHRRSTSWCPSSPTIAILDWARRVPLRPCSRPAAASGCCRRRSTIPS